MRNRTIGMILGVLNLLLIVGGVVLYMGKDRTAPEITLEEVAYIYEKGLAEDILLEGVTAWDAQDGDVTERVVVEKIVTDKRQKIAIITYGVADSAGNVCRASRSLVMAPMMVSISYPAAGEGVFIR